MAFVAKNQVRMHDTDMAGILYFAKQYRFVHDALEDYLESEGITFQHLFTKEKYVTVIVHSEADYYKSVFVGDRLEVLLSVERIGNSAFTLLYQIYRVPKEGQQGERDLVGLARTVHCTVDAKTRDKIPIPDSLKERLKKHLIQ